MTLKMDKTTIGVIILVLLVLIILVGPLLWIYVNSLFFGKQEILNVARSIATNRNDPIEILDAIADWEKENMVYDIRPVYFYPIPPFLIWRIPSPDPTWVMSIKRGGCEEFAILFAEIARSAGIQSRVVYNPGEDHTWCEVLINGTWVHFDPTLSKGKRFNNPRIYERPRNESGWGKQLSYVFSVDPSEGNKVDVTRRYTDTGKLIVEVKKDNLPVENARVIIKSRFLMETSPKYKQPLYCLEKMTNKSGICTFELGGNNYTVIAELGEIFGYKAEKLVHLEENSSVYVTINLEQFSLLIPLEYILSIVLVFVAFLLLIINVILRVKDSIKRKLTKKCEVNV